MDDDAYNGRKPSLKFGRGGPEVRGFRTRPGAPMADPTNINPMSRDNSTPKSNWDQMFRNSLAGGANPLSREFRAAQPESPEFQYDPNTTIGYHGGDREEADTFNRPLEARFNPRSLQTMASGGMNHAQRWSAPPPRPPDRSWSPAPFMPRGPRDKFYVTKDGGFFETPLSKDGWKSTPGREVDAIRDKYQTPGTNPKSGFQFGWGSAFA